MWPATLALSKNLRLGYCWHTKFNWTFKCSGSAVSMIGSRSVVLCVEVVIPGFRMTWSFLNTPQTAVIPNSQSTYHRQREMNHTREGPSKGCLP
ncbi:hypothetical protein TNIN_437971 [Trichonephila inaurata madagascariensis]|uniref:Uncharacterized protein n=1 Tax=Trichonephila inaurata madagascariensis TaxID=2747483 RepID=A0A8X6XF34_9ARAC|nr:hypothetical protein TNIN_437971 [Trichonephila inaurata madagascariensis]